MRIEKNNINLLTHIFAGVCYVLQDPANGNITVTKPLASQAIAIYTCDSGYQLSGYHARTCMSNRMWSGEEPTCLRMKNTFVVCIHIYTSRFTMYKLNWICIIALSVKIKEPM